SSIKIFISVDMEGIGGIGTAEMTHSSGKDYQLGRRLMTAEVNAVVSAIIKFNNDAEILVNDSHGDMQNLNHQELDPRVTYIQGNKKPFGMVQGLDESYDAAIFIGYHARAGTARGFLAHTGSGSVKGLWLNGREVGEGGLNTYFSGEMNVPVILAAGDDVFTKQFGKLVDCELVATKNAVTAQVAKLKHGTIVERELFDATTRALKNRKSKKPIKLKTPVEIKLKFSTPTHAEILQAIPGMEWIDGYTVQYKAKNMVEAYALIRLMYKYVKP
ncbi:MAG TPA: aminopeptidase, partial [Candidatus Marinimicrobia bacterium]|nr:aminopeptidase [Candidatus Neomarinimicrobiota bacterium]